MTLGNRIVKTKEIPMEEDFNELKYPKCRVLLIYSAREKQNSG